MQILGGVDTGLTRLVKRYCTYDLSVGHHAQASSFVSHRTTDDTRLALGWDLSAAQIGTRSNGAAGWAGPSAR